MSETCDGPDQASGLPSGSWGPPRLDGAMMFQEYSTNLEGRLLPDQTARGHGQSKETVHIEHSEDTRLSKVMASQSGPGDPAARKLEDRVGVSPCSSFVMYPDLSFPKP